MTDRCEPPPELRGMNGWHWVQPHDWEPIPARWHAAENVGNEPRWTSSHHVPSGTPAWAYEHWGWRYLTPVATPAEVEELRAEVARLSIGREVWFQDARTLRARVETLERACQSALISLENAHPHYPYNDEWVARHNAAIAAARAALSPATEGALDTTPPAS